MILSHGSNLANVLYSIPPWLICLQVTWLICYTPHELKNFQEVQNEALHLIGIKTEAQNSSTNLKISRLITNITSQYFLMTHKILYLMVRLGEVGMELWIHIIILFFCHLTFYIIPKGDHLT